MPKPKKSRVRRPRPTVRQVADLESRSKDLSASVEYLRKRQEAALSASREDGRRFTARNRNYVRALGLLATVMAEHGKALRESLAGEIKALLNEPMNEESQSFARDALLNSTVRIELATAAAASSGN